MSTTYTLITIVSLFVSLFIHSVTSNRGEDLADLVNAYRRSNGLSKIPYSKALMKVAKLHCEVSCRVGSLSDRECWNPHSWDEIPGYSQSYETCCYSPFSGKSMYCAWDKPREIAGFDADGHEITAGSYGSRALGAWKKSSAHDDCILQRNKWKYSKWKAIGCASNGDTSHCWFASKEDTSYYSSQGEPSCPGGGGDDEDDTVSQPSCVTLSISGSYSSMEGTYRKSGTSKGYPAYDGPNGYWLYVGDLFGGRPDWMISQTKGLKTYNNGYCPGKALLDCDDNFRGRSQQIRISSCGRLELAQEEGSEANEAKKKVNVWLVAALLVAVLICGISLCFYMKKRKKRRETKGIKVMDGDIFDNEVAEEEEEEEDDGVVIKFVDEEETEMDGGETAKTVN